VTVEYKTRVEQNGIALQVAKIASNTYIKIVRLSDSVVIRSFNDGPYIGKLRPLYQLFKDRGTMSLEGSILNMSKEQKICAQSIANIVHRNEYTDYVLNNSGAIFYPMGGGLRRV